MCSERLCFSVGVESIECFSCGLDEGEHSKSDSPRVALLTVKVCFDDGCLCVFISSSKSAHLLMTVGLDCKKQEC